MLLSSAQLHGQPESAPDVAVAAAGSLEEAVTERPQHVVVAGDLDAGQDAASIRFWTGRQSLAGVSVCYRDAWASARPGKPGHTFVPDNPLGVDWDWPFRRIDCILVRCGEHGGPSLAIDSCKRVFDEAVDGVWASDHFGLHADLTIPVENNSNVSPDIKRADSSLRSRREPASRPAFP